MLEGSCYKGILQKEFILLEATSPKFLPTKVLPQNSLFESFESKLVELKAPIESDPKPNVSEGFIEKFN